jgi:hypothetical protein
MTSDELLLQFGLKYEDLTSAEKDTFNSWLMALNENQLSVDRIRDYISAMRDAVEEELTQTKNGSNEDYLLKARLRNYMLLEAFLTTPDKARKAMERSLKGVAGKK